MDTFKCHYAFCENRSNYNLCITWNNSYFLAPNYNLCYNHIQQFIDDNQHLIKIGQCKFIQGPPK